MKKSVNFYDFERAFRHYNRSNNFSYDGLRALFDYLESYEDSTGEEIELDVIALCCDFTEYDSIDDFLREHDLDIDRDDLNDEDWKEAVFKEIEYHTQLIRIEDSESFIIQNY